MMAKKPDWRSKVQTPWQLLDIKLKKCPAMLSDEEKKYLYWVGQDVWKGKGEIVEIGCWLGGSTCHLVMGLRENERFIGRKVYVFDNFVWNNFYDQELRKKCDEDPEIKNLIEKTDYFKKPIKSNKSFEPLFKAICKNELDRLDVKCAELLEHPYKRPGGELLTWPTTKKVEILFIDAAKTWYSLHYLFSIFSKSLIPDKSLIISQDYRVPYSYYHVIFFEIFSAYFEVEHVITGGGTVTFRLRKEFPFPEKVNFPLTENDLGYEELCSIFERTIKKWHEMGDDNTALHLRGSYAVMCHNKGHHQEAMKQIEIAWLNWHNKKALQDWARRYLNEPNLQKWGLY